MVLNLNFTKEEKIKFLDELGYRFTIIESHYWDQWGNHDSQGKWKTEYIDCAIKHTGIANKDDNIDSVFEREIQNKLKRFLLNQTVGSYPGTTGVVTIDWDSIH